MALHQPFFVPSRHVFVNLSKTQSLADAAVGTIFLFGKLVGQLVEAPGCIAWHSCIVCCSKSLRFWNLSLLRKLNVSEFMLCKLNVLESGHAGP